MFTRQTCKHPSEDPAATVISGSFCVTANDTTYFSCSDASLCIIRNRGPSVVTLQILTTPSLPAETSVRFPERATHRTKPSCAVVILATRRPSSKAQTAKLPSSVPVAVMLPSTLTAKLVTGALCFPRRYTKLGSDSLWGSDVKSKFCDSAWTTSMAPGWPGMKANCHHGRPVGVATPSLAV